MEHLDYVLVYFLDRAEQLPMLFDSEMYGFTQKSISRSHLSLDLSFTSGFRFNLSSISPCSEHVWGVATVYVAAVNSPLQMHSMV